MLELTPVQAHAVAHAGGPLLVLGGAGSGKTTVLARRFAWLVAQGHAAPESILVLTPSAAGSSALRQAVEDALDRPYEELAIHTVREFCARLLREEAAEAGIDPFFAPVTRAARLALLLDRIDDLHLRNHDIGGRPAVLLADVVDRIDRLKDGFVTATDYAAWADALPAADDAERARAAREVEFARLYLDHDRLLAEVGALDAGELVLRTVSLLRDRPHVRARVAERYGHLLVDEYADLGFGSALLVELLGTEHEQLTVCADDDGAARRMRAAATKNVRDFALAHPGAEIVRLERSLRCPQRVLDAARAVVEPIADRIGTPLQGEPGGTVRFWCAADERAQAQAVAAEIERLVHAGCPPGRIGVVVRSPRDEGRQITLALEERAIALRTVGEADFFAQAEVRDVLAWLRLLADPTDAGAAVRALARPPVALRSVDIARCVQIARRRKLDMVSALRAATESPQLPPEAREHIHTFLRVHRDASRVARQRAPGPLRAPPRRPSRAAPPAGLLGAGRRRRAAREPRPPRRARELLRAARSARDAARLRALCRRRRRRRPARRGRRDRPAARRRRAADGARRGRRPRSGLGLRARADVGADARPAPAGGRDDPRRAAQGGARPRRPRRARRRRCGA